MAQIKNLLFDLGGVIADINRQHCVDAFKALGLKNAEDYFGDYAQAGVFMEIEDGSIGVDQFHDTLRRVLPEGVTDSDIDAAFQQFIVGIPRYRLKALRDLRDSGYGVYMLSNTNPIMWSDRLAEEFTKEGLRREDYFDGMITSFEAGSAKPSDEIFRYTIDTLGIKPEETLFFDDGQVNVLAARAAGFEAVHVQPGTEFMDYLPGQAGQQ